MTFTNTLAGSMIIQTSQNITEQVTKGYMPYLYTVTLAMALAQGVRHNARRGGVEWGAKSSAQHSHSTHPRGGGSAKDSRPLAL